MINFGPKQDGKMDSDWRCSHGNLLGECFDCEQRPTPKPEPIATLRYTQADLDRAVLLAVQEYRIKNSGKAALDVAKDLFERIDKQYLRKVGFGVIEQHISNELEHFAAEAVAKEREQCAAVADRVADKWPAFDDRGRTAFLIADIIRARGKDQK